MALKPVSALRKPEAVLVQGTFTSGRFLAHASILCTVMGADQNKENFPYPGIGGIV